MKYDLSQKAHLAIRGITLLAIARIFLQIALFVGIIWLSIFAYSSINTSLKENDTNIMREFGNAWGEITSEFTKGVEETNETNESK